VADRKKTSDKQAAPQDIEDAVVVEGPVENRSEKPDQDVTGDAPVPDETDAISDPQAPDAEVDADIGAQTDPAYPASAETPQPDPVSEQTDRIIPAEQPARTEKVVVRKGGFVPMVLGGVLAAVIGFGLAHSGFLEGVPIPGNGGMQDSMADIAQRTEAQGNIVSDLSGRISALEDAPAVEAPEVQDVIPMIEDLTIQIGVLAQRIDALEARPAASDSGGEDAQAALAQTRAEMDQIRQALDAQRAELAALTEDAVQEEEAAQLTARTAMQRAALTRIQTALDTGTGYGDTLTDLQASDMAVPQPLLDQAEEGVATLADLQSSFPDVARDALRAARRETGGTGVTDFLQTQLGLRSLQPREGNDPDAVLSRAEAALRDGRLADTLSELDALPESANAVLESWRSQAETRLATVAAAQDLAQTLNTN